MDKNLDQTADELVEKMSQEELKKAAKVGLILGTRLITGAIYRYMKKIREEETGDKQNDR